MADSWPWQWAEAAESKLETFEGENPSALITILSFSPYSHSQLRTVLLGALNMSSGKKKDEPVKRVLLGRPGNHVKMGIVGLPNVGKSSMFNLLCSMHVPAEN